MKSIIATIPQVCLGYGGAFTVYEGLGLLPEVELQTHETFKPSPDTKLVIGFGCNPPKIGDYKTAFVFCSPIIQCEHSGELELLNGKIQDVNNRVLDYLFLLHEPDAVALNVIWGENILPLFPLFNKQLPEPQFEDRKGICCGGHIRGNKNYYNQVLGFTISNYRKEGFFSFGLKPHLKHFSNILFKQDLNIPDYVLSNDLYYDNLRKMKLGLQVSLSESFCYFVLELSLMCVPTIVSKTIDWYAKDLRLKYCVVENPNDPCEIAEKINFILDNENIYLDLCNASQEVAQKVLVCNLEKTKKILQNLIE
jgi:hypothetical protein